MEVLIQGLELLQVKRATTNLQQFPTDGYWPSAAQEEDVFWEFLFLFLSELVFDLQLLPPSACFGSDDGNAASENEITHGFVIER